MSPFLSSRIMQSICLAKTGWSSGISVMVISWLQARRCGARRSPAPSPTPPMWAVGTGASAQSSAAAAGTGAADLPRRGGAMEATHQPFTLIDPVDGPGRVPSYAQAVLVPRDSQLLFISGQAPQTPDGFVPDSFEDQCRLTWRNLVAVLAAADMTVGNLVRVTITLSDLRYREASARIRREFLGEHRPAIVGIVADVWINSWFLEIEAIAAA
ncbi:MAG: RidA family protein [Actinobacteria bacterium]|nr:MAG: RidA family protein [Actinomycetota bacterium]